MRAAVIGLGLLGSLLGGRSPLGDTTSGCSTIVESTLTVSVQVKLISSATETPLPEPEILETADTEGVAHANLALVVVKAHQRPGGIKQHQAGLVNGHVYSNHRKSTGTGAS